MFYIKKYLIFILLLNLINCNLSNKNKNSEQEDAIISSLDSNQKQAFIFFKDLVKNKQYSKDFDQAIKEPLEALKARIEELKNENKQDIELQNKLDQGFNCDYDDSKMEKLFVQLGNDNVKKFLQQLHLVLKAINDGTHISFTSLNLTQTPKTLSEKQEIVLDVTKRNLYIQFYFYSNDIFREGYTPAEYFFNEVMKYHLAMDNY
ncbi:hypothetical protein BAPKO_3500 (plasmid) [Borreliella afzelii PKo]|uniref:hypothetical protein n=1 Tax=Borreliella afzelii TaxID=29518 RepID=UPI0000DB92C8|nr:hypothetical protein BAPKO_3500 [Borreliella afzelii PKo]